MNDFYNISNKFLDDFCERCEREAIKGQAVVDGLNAAASYSKMLRNPMYYFEYKARLEKFLESAPKAGIVSGADFFEMILKSMNSSEPGT